MSEIIKISEAATLALHAMVILSANPDKPLSAKHIASKLSASGDHLSKVLQRLVRIGLITSTKGPNGGFMLKKPSEQIYLIDIYEAIEGPFIHKECLLENRLCNKDDECIFGGMLGKISNELKEHMKNKRLSDLFGINSKEAEK